MRKLTIIVTKFTNGKITQSFFYCQLFSSGLRKTKISKGFQEIQSIYYMTIIIFLGWKKDDDDSTLIQSSIIFNIQGMFSFNHQSKTNIKNKIFYNMKNVTHILKDPITLITLDDIEK
jgi:hypothetical protein